MPDEPVKAMGGGCLGGLLGAFLGIVTGGFVGPVLATTTNDLRGNPDPFAKQASGLFDGCFGFIGMWLGAGIGGMIGGIGGSVLGAGLAARGSSTPRGERRSVRGSGSASLPKPPPESPDAELARLKDRVAELEEKNRKEGLSKEE